MPRGIVGESGSDRATEKMNKWMSRAQTVGERPLSLIEQFKKFYPETWKDEIKNEREEWKRTKHG